MFKISFFVWKKWFSEKIMSFLKTGKSSNFAVDWDWKIENTQNFQNLCILKVLWKRLSAFSENNLKLLKIPNGSKITVECDWNSQISQNVLNLVIFQKKTDAFFSKMSFSRIIKWRNFAAGRDKIFYTSQNFQKQDFWRKLIECIGRKSWLFFKKLEVGNLV